MPPSQMSQPSRPTPTPSSAVCFARHVTLGVKCKSHKCGSFHTRRVYCEFSKCHVARAREQLPGIDHREVGSILY